MYKVNSVSKALLIVDLMANAEEMSLGEISKFTKLNEATVGHLVSTLVMHGYLKQRKKYGKYSIGARFLDIGKTLKGESQYSEGTIRYLIELSRLINGTIHVVVWYGSNVLFSKAFDYSNESIKVIPHEWSKIPLHAVCWGKLILACMSNEDLRKYFRNTSFGRLTPNTITKVGEMKDHLETVRRETFAFEFEECFEGQNGEAAGIKNSNGEIIGAVSIQGSSSHLTRDVLFNIRPNIKNCALQMSRELGYPSLTPITDSPPHNPLLAGQ